MGTTFENRPTTQTITRGAAAAMAAQSSSATEPRKRKRGALQDISNSTTKKPLEPTDSVVKKETVSLTSVRVVPTKAKAKLASSKPPTGAAAKRKATKTAGTKRASAATKKATESKRRKQDAGDETTHAPQKIQTSLLSFQTTKSVARKPKAAVVDSEPKVTDESAVTKPTSASLDETFECNESIDSDVPTTDEVVVATTQPGSSAEATDIYAPRPYVFRYDHTGSGFDEKTYAAQIRDIDALTNDQRVTPCPKLVRELDHFRRKHELKYLPAPTYIGEIQTDINEKMRTILIDWLVEVGEEYELDSQTFHKAVNLVDRCLQKFKINRKQFQLLGCACMMIAAKFEEVYGPNVEEFVYISDQTYTAEEMLQMEAKVLKALEYRIASTTCHGFLSRFVRAGCELDKQRSLVMYLCDLALLYYHMLKYRPSQLAASAVFLARVMTGEKEAWSPTLHHFTQYTPSDLQECIQDLYRLHRAEAESVSTQRDKAKAVSEKYFSEKHHSASMISSADELVLEKSFAAYGIAQLTSSSPAPAS